MSDADLGRIAKATSEIAHHLKALTKIQETFNENFVAFTKTWLETVETEDQPEMEPLQSGDRVLIKGQGVEGIVKTVDVHDRHQNDAVEVTVVSTGNSYLFHPGELKKLETR